MTRYQRLIAEGLCGTCGKPRELENKSVCAACKEKARQRGITKREKAVAAGKCPACCKRPVADGKSKCEKCLGSGAASQRRKAKSRKREGLCPSCGEPAMPGKTVCQDCSSKMSDLSSARYHERRAAGKCNYCDNDPVPGSTMCQHHLDLTKQQREDLKLEVMNAYGGPKCAWCDEDDIRYLEIDHIEGGGRQHTQEIGGGGHGLRCWLKANNFPPGFRILCRTCNGRAHTEKCRAEDRTLSQKHGT